MNHTFYEPNTLTNLPELMQTDGDALGNKCTDTLYKPLCSCHVMLTVLCVSVASHCVTNETIL